MLEFAMRREMLVPDIYEEGPNRESSRLPVQLPNDLSSRSGRMRLMMKPRVRTVEADEHAAKKTELTDSVGRSWGI